MGRLGDGDLRAPSGDDQLAYQLVGEILADPELVSEITRWSGEDGGETFGAMIADMIASDDTQEPFLRRLYSMLPPNFEQIDARRQAMAQGLAAHSSH